MNASAPQVFISYRREETAGHAGRLYDSMVARFGEPHVFVDVELAPGIDFVQRIKEAVGSCHVLLVMIGPRWAAVTDDEGQQRIADPDDFVRLEVETALSRPDVTVIPVLVAGAEMPDPDDLPEGLRLLTHRNALELSDMRWRYDVGRLNATLDDLLADTSAVQAGPGPAPETITINQPAARARSTARLFIDGMLVAGVAALLGRWLADPIDPAEVSSEGGQIATAILRRAVTWAVLGAALGIWLSIARGEGRLFASRAVLGLVIGALAGALGGVIFAVPQYAQDLNFSADQVERISIAAFAVSGGLIGVLLGALWTPRSVAIGFTAGLVGGALVRLVWTELELSPQPPAPAFQESLGIGIQCLLIVGLVLAALQTLSAEPRSALEGGSIGPRGHAPA